MNEAAKSLCERLKIKYDEALDPYYVQGFKLFTERGKGIVSGGRLIFLNRKYNIFRTWFEDVMRAADIVREDSDLLLFTYILYSIIKDKAPISILEMPDRESIETDFAPLFSLLYFVEEMVERMEKRGLPFEVISDTLSGFDTEINDYYDIFGRSGMRIYVSWFLGIVYGDIIRVGRFTLQICKFRNRVRIYSKNGDIKILVDGEDVHEKGMIFGSAGQTDNKRKYFANIEEKNGCITGYSADSYGEVRKEKITLCGYKEEMRFGDNAVYLHIPSHEPFTPQICGESIEKANEIMAKFYPEYEFNAFCCCSWLLEKRLKDIMGKDTNITRFADRFTLYPIKSQGKGVYSFLFHKYGEPSPKELPYNNSMQKKVKKYLTEGNFFYEKGGVILRGNIGK